MAAKSRRAGERKKRIEEVMTYAWGHRTRVLILILLNEGVYSPGEIAAIIEEPLKNVANHMRELVDAGSIELVKTQQRRNTTQHYYRAVQMPFYSDEEMAAMTPQQRTVTYGLVIQSMVAEMMAGLYAGKMQSDPRTWLSWRWFNVDEEGRADIADELQRSWDRMWEIEGDSTNRRAVSGEEATSILVAQAGFERARRAPNPPPSPESPSRD